VPRNCLHLPPVAQLCPVEGRFPGSRRWSRPLRRGRSHFLGGRVGCPAAPWCCPGEGRGGVPTAVECGPVEGHVVSPTALMQDVQGSE